VTLQMFQIALRIRIIARWCKLPTEELEQLDRLVQEVRQRYPKQRGMTEKNKALMRRLEEPRFRDQVQLLPIILLEEARMNPGKPSAPAKARTALAIELLLMTSVRRGNLLSLELDRSIKRNADDSETRWVITLQANEVKNGEELRFGLPAQSAAMLETYLRDWRPKLSAQPSSWLFPDAEGNCMDARSMASAIVDQTKRVLGVPITPHQFRHISVELYLQEHPDALQTVSQHLGHRDINTTRNYYARAKQLEASRRFQEEILRGRRVAGVRIRKGKPSKQPINIDDWEDDL
jgi:integrase